VHKLFTLLFSAVENVNLIKSFIVLSLLPFNVMKSIMAPDKHNLAEHSYVKIMSVVSLRRIFQSCCETNY